MATRVSDIPKFVVDGIDVIFNRELSKPRELFYPNICMEKPNEKETGTYQQLGGLGPAEALAEGDDFTFDKIQESYTTTIKVGVKGKGVEATMASMRFDLYNVVPQIFGKPMVDKLIQMREQSVADQYNHAFATTAADGVYYISDSHPLERSAKLNDNLITNGAMSVTLLKEAYNRFMFIYDQTGNFMGSRATTLLIHPAQMFDAVELLQSNLLARELSNTTNSLKGLPVKIVTSPYLDYNVTTGLSPWFMLDNSLDAGVVLQRQMDVDVDTWLVHENRNMRGSAAEIYECGIISPGYGIVGSVGGYTA